MERGIGQWKRRFQVLHNEIRVTTPVKICKIIFTCVLLHNICKDRNIQMVMEDDQQPAKDNIHIAANDGDNGDEAELAPAGRLAHNALFYKDDFARFHFK